MDYVLHLEQNFDPTEKYIQYFDWETGAILQSKPVLLSPKYFSDGKGNASSPSFLSLTKIDKDETGRVTEISSRYVGGSSAIVDEDQDIRSYTYEECN